jgi:hypothetical protein
MIELRGNPVPGKDRRVKRGLPPMERTIDTSNHITEVSTDGERRVPGALADSVQEEVATDARPKGSSTCRCRSGRTAGAFDRVSI